MSEHLPPWPLRRVFLRDLLLKASIGIYPHEEAAPQRILVNVELGVEDDPALDGLDLLHRVVDYEAVANRIRAIVAQGHVRLVETLTERLAATCLEDPRVTRVRVRVEKLDVFADAAGAGVELERAQLRPLAPANANEYR